MIYLIEGSDNYLQEETINRIIREQKATNKCCYDFDKYKEEILVLIDKESRQETIFCEKKVVTIKNSIKELRKEKKSLDLFKKLNKEEKTIVVFIEDKPVNKKDSIDRFVNKKYSASPLKNSDLINWAQAKTKENNTEISFIDLQKLINYTGNDLWLLSNEIKKLSLYCKNRKINSNDIDLLVKSKIETDIFKAIEMTAKKQKRETFKTMYSHIEKGDAPLYLLSMINFQFRNLLLVKKSQQKSIHPKELDMHPYVFQKTLNVSSFFSLTELEKYYEEILRTEIKIKTGEIDPVVGLDLLLLKI